MTRWTKILGVRVDLSVRMRRPMAQIGPAWQWRQAVWESARIVTYSGSVWAAKAVAISSAVVMLVGVVAEFTRRPMGSTTVDM